MMPCCGGNHEPDPQDSYVDFRGYRYFPPFICFCCGMTICGRQFAYGRAGGLCDTGACQTDLQRSHARPEWYHPHGPSMLENFAKHVQAEELDALKEGG